MPSHSQKGESSRKDKQGKRASAKGAGRSAANSNRAPIRAQARLKDGWHRAAAKMGEAKQVKRSPRKERGTGKRAAKGTASSGFSLSPERQEEIAAVTLLGIALLTALGAFNLSGGNVLDGWTKILSLLFGWGRMLAPLFFGGLGIWLLLDSLDLRPDIGWERPFGLVIIFLVVLTAMHLTPQGGRGFDASSRGEGGGLIGYALSDFMIGAIGVPGTVLILLIALFIGLILLFNIALARIFALSIQAARGFRSLITNSRGSWFGRAAKTPLPAPTPTPRIAERAPRPRPEPRPPEPIERNPPAPVVSPQRPAVAARIVGGQPQAPVHREWRLPKVADILEDSTEQEMSAHEIRTKVRQIEETLAHFGVPAKVIEVNQGPTITQFGVEPGFLEQKGPDGSVRRTKVKVSRISALQHDLELALAAAPVRVEAPVPGKPIVGIEVPNSQISLVSLRGVMESEDFKRLSAKSRLAIALGQDVSGQPIVTDLASMPHLLIAGATGSGKSVCINALIACLLMTNTPDDLRFVMVDPKRVELSAFNGIPHLVTPVVVEMDSAVKALQTAVQEMDERFKTFAKVGARNIESYHQLTRDQPEARKLPYQILVVDELADLMMVAADEVEKAITRLAQMARATGIHLVLATQRPSVDVVTGLIKANFPSRISFAVTSQIDSRVVLDSPGAEKLLGRGDMLYMASDSSKLARLQGCFVSDRELEKLVNYWKKLAKEVLGEPPPTGADLPELPRAHVSPSSVVAPPPANGEWVQNGLWNNLKPASKSKSEDDDLLAQAIELAGQNDRISISLLHRKLRIGYSRAARLMDLLEQKGHVGPEEGSASKGRAVIKSKPGTSAPPERDFESLDGFDDWTDEDWADLDKE